MTYSYTTLRDVTTFRLGGEPLPKRVGLPYHAHLMTSIGEFNERSLHRSLKERYAVVGSATEQAIEGFVVWQASPSLEALPANMLRRVSVTAVPG